MTAGEIQGERLRSCNTGIVISISLETELLEAVRWALFLSPLQN